MENEKKAGIKPFYIIIAVILFVALIIGIGWINTNNDLNNSEQAYEAQWSQVENVMQRRADLIPNLTASVKGQMHNEQKIFNDLAKARSNYGAAKTDTEKMKADSQINNSVGALFNVIHENYPKLESNKQVHDLMVELEGSENRISVERKKYITDIQSYNQKVRNFPSSVVANAKGLKVKDYYKADSSAQKAPKVDLD